MPDEPIHKARAHPSRTPATSTNPPARTGGYAELDVTSNFTFLAGASHPDELVEASADLGHRAVAIADLHSLAGIVRAHVAAKKRGVQFIVGARVVPRDGAGVSLLLYPTDRPAYAGLCRLLTLGKSRVPKGHCDLSLGDVCTASEGLLAVAVPPAEPDDACAAVLGRLADRFDDDRLSLAISRTLRQDDDERVRRVTRLGADVRIPLVATNAVHSHAPHRRRLQDVLTCIRHGCTIDAAGWRLFENAERHLKPAEEMRWLFAGSPGAVARTLEIAQRTAGFSLDQLRYEYPDEVVPPGTTPMKHLTDLTWAGAQERFPLGVPESVTAQIRHELALIDELRYAPYFLTVQEIVVFARSRGILCQGRGAAANSAVCYCLGVTAVDPARVKHALRAVHQQGAQRTARHRHRLRARATGGGDPAPVREVRARPRRADRGGHLLSGAQRGARGGEGDGSLARHVDPRQDIDWWDDGSRAPPRLKRAGPQPGRPHTPRLVLSLAGEIMGFPRHLSQHVGGFVITRSRSPRLVPIENAAMDDRTVIEWDKDDIDAMGMLKVDVPGAGHAHVHPQDASIWSRCDQGCRTLHARDDPGRGPRGLRHDLQGRHDRRLPDREPRADVDAAAAAPARALRPCDRGGDRAARAHPGQDGAPVSPPTERRGAGLRSPERANACSAHAGRAALPGAGDVARDRRGGVHARRGRPAPPRHGRVEAQGRRDPQLSARSSSTACSPRATRGLRRACFEQIKGFSEYGFPESHAASFALLVYVSKRGSSATSTRRRSRPALINSQPMGFYHGPAARDRAAMRRSMASRSAPIDGSPNAFASLGLTRQRRWEVQALRDDPMPLFQNDAPRTHRAGRGW
jgi:error-prone DNA polymerase